MTEWTDRMKRELSHVEIFPIEVLRILPACEDFDAGIYFLWKDDALQYIGKSRQICNRLVMHDHANATGHLWAKKPNAVPYDCYTCLIVDSGRLHDRNLDNRLKPLERAYIAHYQPPFNSLYENVGT